MLIVGQNYKFKQNDQNYDGILKVVSIGNEFVRLIITSQEKHIYSLNEHKYIDFFIDYFINNTIPLKGYNSPLYKVLEGISAKASKEENGKNKESL